MPLYTPYKIGAIYKVFENKSENYFEIYLSDISKSYISHNDNHYRNMKTKSVSIHIPTISNVHF